MTQIKFGSEEAGEILLKDEIREMWGNRAAEFREQIKDLEGYIKILEDAKEEADFHLDEQKKELETLKADLGKITSGVNSEAPDEE